MQTGWCDRILRSLRLFGFEVGIKMQLLSIKTERPPPPLAIDLRLLASAFQDAGFSA